MDAVVVSHNSEGDLAQLFACKELRAAFSRIIVVDNASTDGSVEVAQRNGADTLTLATNIGFGAAANRGALRTTGPVFAIVNPDIQLEEKSVAERLAEHLTDRDVGLVAPALVLPDGSTQDSARTVPTPLDLILRRILRSRRGEIMRTSPGEVSWVVGAFVVVSRRAFSAIGGFDTRYPLYFEDVDLCVRMREAGWITVFDPTVRAQHLHRAASRRNPLGRVGRMHLLSAYRFYRAHPHYLMRTVTD